MKTGSFKDASVTGGFWLAWLFFATALLIPNPTAVFFLSFLSVTVAVIPLAFGDTKRRIASFIAFLLAVLLASSVIGKAKNDPYFKKNRATPSLQKD